MVDTELFSLPDNDPVPDTPVTPIPVSELVTAVFDALERGVSQVYVPGWFSDLAAQKAKDLDTYLSGVAEWMAVNRRRD
jgi:hypothetical protein